MGRPQAGTLAQPGTARQDTYTIRLRCTTSFGGQAGILPDNTDRAWQARQQRRQVRGRRPRLQRDGRVSSKTPLRHVHPFLTGHQNGLDRLDAIVYSRRSCVLFFDIRDGHSRGPERRQAGRSPYNSGRHAARPTLVSQARRQSAVATAGGGNDVSPGTGDATGQRRGLASLRQAQGRRGCVKTRFLQNEANVFEALRSYNEFIC